MDAWQSEAAAATTELPRQKQTESQQRLLSPPAPHAHKQQAQEQVFEGQTFTTPAKDSLSSVATPAQVTFMISARNDS